MCETAFLMAVHAVPFYLKGSMPQSLPIRKRAEKVVPGPDAGTVVRYRCARLHAAQVSTAVLTLHGIEVTLPVASRSGPPDPRTTHAPAYEICQTDDYNRQTCYFVRQTVGCQTGLHMALK